MIKNKSNTLPILQLFSKNYLTKSQRYVFKSSPLQKKNNISFETNENGEIRRSKEKERKSNVYKIHGLK